jgi:hypothetical protein
MTLPKQHWLRGVLVVMALVVLVTALWVYGFRFFKWAGSDATVTALLADRILDTHSPIPGNWYWANGDVWVLAPHLIAIIPVAILGVGPLSLVISVAIGFALEWFALMRVHGWLGGERWIGVLAALVTLAAWSPTHVSFVYVQLTSGFSAVVYLLMFSALAVHLTPNARRWHWGAAVALVVLWVVQNPARGLVLVVPPTIVVCAWPWRDLSVRRRLAMFGAVAGGWALSWIIYNWIFVPNLQFSWPRGHIAFVFKDADGIVANLEMLGRGVLLLCGGSEDEIWRAVPGGFVLAGALVLVSREIVVARAVTPLRFLCVAFVAQLGVVLVPMIVGSLLIDPESVRYMMPSLLALFGLAAVLAIRALGEAALWRRFATVWLVMVALAAVAAIPSLRPPPAKAYVHPSSGDLKKVRNVIAKRKLTRGFSNLINANMLNLLTRGRSTTCPVYFLRTLVPQRWLADTNCYVPSSIQNRFYVVTDRVDTDLAAVDATFPAPVERIRAGSAYDVSIYETPKAELDWFSLPLRDGDDARFPMRLPSTSFALHRREVARDGTSMVATGNEGFVLYGPYMTLPAGTYEVSWIGSGVDSPGDITFSADIEFGKNVLASQKRVAAQIGTTRGELARLRFTLPVRSEAVEFPVFSTAGGRVRLDELVLEKR